MTSFPNYCNSVSSIKKFQIVASKGIRHLFDSILKTTIHKIPFIIQFNLNSNKCTICHLAKLKRLPFKYNNKFSTQSFDLIHCDLWGPCGKSTYDGKVYFLIIVDDFSRFTWIYLLTNKFDAPMKLQ